ncbi:hypothetical protein AMJ96_CH02636 [Rhizobium sp. N113]|nr:hypothetical protein AMJ98_CH02629 [Rhizobium sp. N1341]ANL22337.1 hypothetical protein AMJ96_CH02636 [Rhizobium sp. N113]ANM41123.1 hypothetical protein AMK03_CH02634 [Rhizobium sp. N741]
MPPGLANTTAALKDRTGRIHLAGMQLLNLRAGRSRCAGRHLAQVSICDWKNKHESFCASCSSRQRCGGFFEWYDRKVGSGGLGQYESTRFSYSIAACDRVPASKNRSDSARPVVKKFDPHSILERLKIKHMYSLAGHRSHSPIPAIASGGGGYLSATPSYSAPSPAPAPLYSAPTYSPPTVQSPVPGTSPVAPQPVAPRRFQGTRLSSGRSSFGSSRG